MAYWKPLLKLVRHQLVPLGQVILYIYVSFLKCYQLLLSFIVYSSLLRPCGFTQLSCFVAAVILVSLEKR